MITGRIDITSDEWTEIGGGATRLQFSAKGSNGVKVHFAENDVTPNGVSTYHVFGSYVNGFDFDQAGYPDGQKIWVKSIAPNDVLCVTRDANFYFLFIPSGSDGLTTSDGDTFRALGNG